MNDPPADNTKTDSGKGLSGSILSKLGDGIGAILTANEALKNVREQIIRLQGQLIDVIGSSNYHIAKIEGLESRLSAAESENIRLRERIEALERAQQYQAGRLDEAARRSE